MTDRERFEAWVLEEDSEQAIEKDERGNYGWLDTRHAWRAWQASRKQALGDLSKAARVHGLTLVITAKGLDLMRLGEITALANPEGEQG